METKKQYTMIEKWIGLFMILIPILAIAWTEIEKKLPEWRERYPKREEDEEEEEAEQQAKQQGLVDYMQNASVIESTSYSDASKAFEEENK